MRKTIYAKMTALPVGLCALAFAVTSCGKTTVWPATLKMRLCHFTVIYR